jgi:hypothetical protein
MFLGTCDGSDNREEEGKDKKERKVFHDDGWEKGMTRDGKEKRVIISRIHHFYTMGDLKEVIFCFR